MEIKIEKNVPIPMKGGKAKWELYPLDKMEVGDSFYIEGERASAISASLQSYKNNQIMKYQNKVAFVCRSDAKGVRVWRTL